MRLITLDQASRYLRRDTTDDDEDLLEIISFASGMVVNHIRLFAESNFLDSDGSLPVDSNEDPDVEIDAVIQGATKYLVAWLYRNRDADTEKLFEGGFMPAPVRAMLNKFRDPVFR